MAINADERKLQELDKEREKEIQRFLRLVSFGFLTMTDLTSYVQITSDIDKSFRTFVGAYKSELEGAMTTEIVRINPLASDERITELIQSAFNKTYPVKGSSSRVSLNDIIFRRSEKMKGDLYNQINARGYDQLSRAELIRINKVVLAKNQKGFARITSNEVHKVQVQSNIDKVSSSGTIVGQKVFVYNTQGDERVRPSHSALNGEELTAAEAQQAQSGVMSDIGCRCYLTPID